MVDETPPSKLTSKQRAFLDDYLSNGFNATKAALEAGYSKDTAYSQGARLLKNVEIKSAIDTFFEENSMGAKEVAWRLTSIARGDLGDVYNEKTGQIDWKKARESGLTYLIKKVDTRTIRTTTINAKGEEVEVEVIEDRYELHDPLKALSLIGKQHGLFIDKQEIKHSGEIDIKAYKGFTPDDWDEPPPAED